MPSKHEMEERIKQSNEYRTEIREFAKIRAETGNMISELPDGMKEIASHAMSLIGEIRSSIIIPPLFDNNYERCMHALTHTIVGYQNLQKLLKSLNNK
jgi:hypothetical protein